MCGDLDESFMSFVINLNTNLKNGYRCSRTSMFSGINFDENKFISYFQNEKTNKSSEHEKTLSYFLAYKIFFP